MRVRLEYGRTGLDVELPDRNVVGCLQYRSVEPLADPGAAVRRALLQPTGTPPLLELARGRRNACVAICDVTRPVPNRVLLPPILETLDAAGIPRSEILILVATGVHRPNLGDELAEMVGPTVAQNYRIENHHGRELGEHTYLGQTRRDVPVWIDSRYVQADLKITVGLIEPHFMAGFSGGRKLICPGLAALETVKVWHGPDFLEHPNARIGCLDGNPVHEENTAIARMAGCDFIVNVVIGEGRKGDCSPLCEAPGGPFRRAPTEGWSGTVPLSPQRGILRVVAGDMEAAFRYGVAFARTTVTATLDAPADIVVTSSAGYPLDATYYQSIKGMVAALPILKPGGTIIIAASLSEGIGSTEFQSLFDANPTLDDFMQRLLNHRGFVMDQWQLEELAKVRRHGKVKVVSDGLSPETLGRLFVEPAASVEAAVADALAEYGPQATIAVIPKGPYVMAELGESVAPLRCLGHNRAMTTITPRETMTPRQRVLAAINHQTPDRVPIDLGGNQTGIHKFAYQALLKHLGIDDDMQIMDAVQQLARPCEAVLERFHVDTRYIAAGAAEGFQGDIVKRQRNGRLWHDLTDEFGITWSMPDDQPFYMDISHHPLAKATVEDIAAYPFPRGDDPGRFAGLRQRALKLKNETPYAVVSGISGVVYEICWYLRGLEQWFMDMLTQPEFCEALLEQTLKFWIDWFRAFLDEVGDVVDVIMIGDDLAGQTGPLFRPEFYRTIVKPRQKQLVQYIRSRTAAKIWYHTCGSCVQYIPDLLDNGINILNPVQISAKDMDPAVLKERFGQEIVFWGGAIDAQHVLASASPETVREHVRRNLEAWKPGGGYVFNNVHNIQAGVPPENIVALFDAAHEYGWYGG